MSHDPYTPFPDHGKWFLFKRFEAWKIVTNYGNETDREWSAKWGKWWFFSFKTPWFHGYIGHKPINLKDTQFYVPELFWRDVDAVEFSARFGKGDIS